jgi:hypothetical protein
MSDRGVMCWLLVMSSWAVGMAVAELPLQQVTLFTSGVGYFDRQGTVNDDAEMEFSFSEAQINDVIKSLIAIDPTGGSVTAVTYDARDPIERTLKSFVVDLSDQPSMAQLLTRLRGAQVRVKVSASDFEGRLVGTESRSRQVGEDRVTETFLNLYTASGLRSIALNDMQELALLDEHLAHELAGALDTLAAGMDADRKAVRIHFAGAGERRVRVGYLLETPVWKTSYRIIVQDETLLLQGWAHVENVTDTDWHDVRVSLVSGQPISFIQNLYDPMYVQRPEVKASLQASASPPMFERESRVQSASPGSRRAAAPAPRVMEVDLAAVEDFGGQVAVAAAAEAGELFQYEIAERVHIPRQSSAMLPIVQAEVEGRPHSIYNEQVNARHPLNGVELNNTTDLFLMQGPVTLFEGGIYAGDARLPDTRAGEQRFLGYAVDLATEVRLERADEPEQITRIQVAQGVLVATRSLERRATYTVRSQRDNVRELVIEHPRQARWELLEPTGDVAETADHYRFRLTLAPQSTTELVVREQRIMDQRIRLSSVADDRVEWYMRERVASPALQAALAELIERRLRISQMQRELADAERELADVMTLQEQLRENMSVVQPSSSSFSDWERQLVAQNRRASDLQAELQSGRAAVTRAQSQLDEWLANLTLE